jgi:hypothetical protein
MPRKKPDLDALIEAMVMGDRTAEYPIQQFGVKAVPALDRAMDDPRACLETRWEPAILRIWEMLIFHATPEIVARMAAFVDHDNPSIRRNLYGKLVSYGSLACAEVLVRAWRAHGDDDRECIYYCVLRQAESSRDRWEPGFVAALYDVVFERLSTGDLGPFYQIAKTLLSLDPRRAWVFLTSPEVFREDNPEILGVLIALDSAKSVVPAPNLIAMLPALRAWSDAADEGGRPGAPYEVALLLLARSDPKAARPLVEEALRSDDEFRRELAGEALTIIECVDDALSVVQTAVAELAEDAGEDGIDFDLLDDVHTAYFLAHEADEIIRNEGFNGYLLETPEGNVSRTPEALEAIGALRAAESVRQAHALVKKLRPRKGEDSALQALYRPEVIARLSELQVPFLEPEPGEEIPSLLRLYALRNPGAFRAPKKRKRRR